MVKKNKIEKAIIGSDFVICKVCQAEVRRSSLEAHYNRRHRHFGPIKRKIKRNRKAFPQISPNSENASELLTSVQSKIIKNKEISNYIEINPESDHLGKFGKPQDPYRWGCYGSSTSEYDFIRKNK